MRTDCGALLMNDRFRPICGRIPKFISSLKPAIQSYGAWGRYWPTVDRALGVNECPSRRIVDPFAVGLGTLAV